MTTNRKATKLESGALTPVTNERVLGQKSSQSAIFSDGGLKASKMNLNVQLQAGGGSADWWLEVVSLSGMLCWPQMYAERVDALKVSHHGRQAHQGVMTDRRGWDITPRISVTIGISDRTPPPFQVQEMARLTGVKTGRFALNDMQAQTCKWSTMAMSM